jgi:hypothetical protein
MYRRICTKDSEILYSDLESLFAESFTIFDTIDSVEICDEYSSIVPLRSSRKGEDGTHEVAEMHRRASGFDSGDDFLRHSMEDYVVNIRKKREKAIYNSCKQFCFLRKSMRIL